MQRPMRADSTGVVQLDKRMAGGLHRGRAYGLVGRKKAGKSAMAGTISYNLNEGGVPHLVVMLEMGSVGYEQRHVGRALGFNSLRFLDQKWRDDTRFLSDVAQYAHVAIDNMHYLDRPGLTFQEMQQQVVYYKHRYGIHGVILDYLQLLNGRAQRQTTAEFQDQVTQWIAEIVKRLDLWFLCLAQMNQDDNVRGGEGMRMAFDQVYAMHGGAAKKTAYLEMWESRYTPRDDVGTSLDPAFELSMAGPHFKEIEQIGKTSNQQDFEL
jgi:replicative DNA helicase